MKVYLDITILPDGDISLAFLWEKLYDALHRSLVEIKDEHNLVPIAAAFPQYQPVTDKPPGSHPLGRKLRLLAMLPEDLQKLNLADALSGLKDYLHLTGIRDVPQSVNTYVSFRRHQTKSSNERLARRKAKRQGLSFEQALAQLEARNKGRIAFSRAPFIRIKSASTGQKFRLMIEQIGPGSTPSPAAQPPRFSTYGLGSACPLPQF